MIYTRRGTVNLRSRECDWPLGKITVEPGKVTLSAMGSETFTTEQITAVDYQQSGLGWCIRFHYRDGPNTFPAYATFQGFVEAQPLLDALVQAGFHLGLPKKWIPGV